MASFTFISTCSPDSRLSASFMARWAADSISERSFAALASTVSASASASAMARVDAGTIVACAGLDPGKRYRLVIAANNLYHDYETTRRLGAMAAREAARMGRRVAVVGVGGLSGSTFTREIDIADDHIASPADEEWNRRVLELMAAGDGQAIRELAGNAAGGARVDMGFKHFAWLAGAMGERWSHGATVHAYGPIYGSGAAVVEFGLDLADSRSAGAIGR